MVASFLFDNIDLNRSVLTRFFHNKNGGDFTNHDQLKLATQRRIPIICMLLYTAPPPPQQQQQQQQQSLYLKFLGLATWILFSHSTVLRFIFYFVITSIQICLGVPLVLIARLSMILLLFRTTHLLASIGHTQTISVRSPSFNPQEGQPLICYLHSFLIVLLTVLSFILTFSFLLRLIFLDMFFNCSTLWPMHKIQNPDHPKIWVFYWKPRTGEVKYPWMMWYLCLRSAILITLSSFIGVLVALWFLLFMFLIFC